MKAVQAVFNGKLFVVYDFFQRDGKILLDTPFRYLIYQISTIMIRGAPYKYKEGEKWMISFLSLFMFWNLFGDIMSKTNENSTFRQDNYRISQDDTLPIETVHKRFSPNRQSIFSNFGRKLASISNVFRILN